MPESGLQYTLYKGNISYITMVEFPKFTAITKHVSLKCCWFRSLIRGPNQFRNVEYTNTGEQTEDICTKLLVASLCIHLRRKSNGW